MSKGRIAVYMRCSSDQQDNLSQIPAISDALSEQGLLTPEIADCLERASTQDCVLGETFGPVSVFADLHVSGRSDRMDRRYGWQCFHERRYEFSSLIVFNADRIIRSARDQVRIILELAHAGCQVRSLTSAPKSGNNAADLLMLSIDAIRAEAESEMTSRRTKAALERIRRENGGVIPWLAGPRPVKPTAARGFPKMTVEQEDAMLDAYFACDETAEQVGERFGVGAAYGVRALRRAANRRGHTRPIRWVREDLRKAGGA